MIRMKSFRTCIGMVFLSGFSLSCGSPKGAPEAHESRPLVTDVAHTQSKRQSIGNCWLYAAASWLESMELAYSNQTINVSESYWTWWHFYNQIVNNPYLEKLETGGSWNIARSIVQQRGFVMEEEFIPEESDQEMSIRQMQAEERINWELVYGGLKDPRERTPENVRKVLDAAFETNMASAESLARRAEEVPLDRAEDGRVLSLRDLISTRSPYGWREIYFPQVYGKNTLPDRRTELARKALWKRVFRALNDRQPVVISLMIDFNALNTRDGSFTGERLTSKGMGSQGGHLIVAEDYTVTDVPGLGRIGRGDVSPELKEKALEGMIESLVVKNSWGSNRPDRGIRNGITTFDRRYLESQFPWKLDSDDPEAGVEWYTTLSSFVLPAGY